MKNSDRILMDSNRVKNEDEDGDENQNSKYIILKEKLNG